MDVTTEIRREGNRWESETHCASMLHSDGDKDRIKNLLCKQGIAGTMIVFFCCCFLLGDYNSVWHGHNCVFFFCACKGFAQEPKDTIEEYAKILLLY